MSAAIDLPTAIASWQRSREIMAEATANEMAWRKYVLAMGFPTPPEKGTVNVELGAGRVLKGVFKQNVKVVNDASLPTRLGAIPEPLRGVIKWSPEFSQTGYNALDASQKLIINESLIFSPATPSLEVAFPKT